MKTTILCVLAVAAVICLLSFKSLPDSPSSKVAMVSLPEGGRGDNQGFLITYGDGTSERRPVEIKQMPRNWEEVQAKTTLIANELIAKGYHFSGSYNLNQPESLPVMVFEKK